jgi:uncharacterized protein
MEQEKCSCSSRLKAIVALVLALGIVAVGILAVLRDKIMQNNDYQFTVTAEGKVYAAPDIATVNFTIQSDIGKNIGDIVKDGNAKMNAIIKALNDLKIESKDIQTTQYELDPIYNYPVISEPYVSSNSVVQSGKTISSTQKVLQGYQLTQGVTVKIRDLNSVGDAIQAAIAAGANQTGGVSFTIDDEAVLQAQARKEAIAKAITKAQDIAKQSGLKLGKLVNVTDGFSPTPVYSNSISYAKTLSVGSGSSDESASIQSGQLEVTDDITLIYKVK